MSQQKLYVGNLPYLTTEREVRSLFREYAPIHSVILVSEKDSDRPLGYGFVELEESQAKCAICRLKNTFFHGRNLRVTKATGKDSKKKIDADGNGAGETTQAFYAGHYGRRRIAVARSAQAEAHAHAYADKH